MELEGEGSNIVPDSQCCYTFFMDFLVVGVVAFIASLLTFFSGFGLGTLLLPAFAVFFPAPVALAATGVVHLLNNLFKGTLVRKLVYWPTVFKFGIPAIPAAIVGALLVTYIPERSSEIVIGSVLVLFAFLELQTWFQRITFPKQFMSLGGVITGFIGGVSGQQGALRSMFLLKSGFNPQQFIATGVLVAVLIDMARIPTYALGLYTSAADITQHQIWLVTFGTVCAFLGAWIGATQMKTVTIGFVRYVVAALMFFVGVLLILGVLGA